MQKKNNEVKIIKKRKKICTECIGSGILINKLGKIHKCPICNGEGITNE
jgi:DnaJ-class molecular chaperone